MITGTIITAFNGQEDEVAKYLRQILILDTPNKIRSVLNAINGDEVSIEGTCDSTILDEIGCDTEPFESDEPLMISLVNTVTELPYSQGLLRLPPFGYYTLPADLITEFKFAEDLNLVKILLPNLAAHVIIIKGNKDAYWLWAEEQGALLWADGTCIKLG